MEKFFYGLNANSVKSKEVRLFATRAISQGHSVFFIVTEKFIPHNFPIRLIPKGAGLQTIELVKKRHFRHPRRFISTSSIEVTVWEKAEVAGRLVNKKFFNKFDPSSIIFNN